MQKYSFFKIINEYFKKSIIFELKQRKDHLVVNLHELQDGR